MSGVLIVGSSASRMYLGVHWFSDIVQGFLRGRMYLVLIETLYIRRHAGRGCDGAPIVVPATRPAA